MKKLFISLLCVACLARMSLEAQASNFVDDWLAGFSSSSSAPDYFEGQKRGYFSGGNLALRWRAPINEAVIGMELPRLKAGCGGIDAFGGSFNYMDPDAMVAKLENILNNAGAVAFDMALNTLCEVCSTVVNRMEAMGNFLNGLSLDECKAAKAIVTKSYVWAGGQNPEVKAEAQKSFSAEQGWDSSWAKAKADWDAAGGKPKVSHADMTAECPSELKNYLHLPSGRTEYTLLANIADRRGLNSDHAALIRGLIGDVAIVEVTYGAGEPAQIEYFPRDRCRQNPSDIVEVVAGLKNSAVKLQAQNVDGTCYDFTSNLPSWVSSRLNELVTAMKNRSAPGAQTTAFARDTPAPVYSILKSAISAGHEGSTMAVLADPVSDVYAAAILRSVLDASFNAYSTLQDLKVRQVRARQGCKVEVYDGAFIAAERLLEHASVFARGIDAVEQAAFSRIAGSERLSMDLAAYNKKAYEGLAGMFSPAMAKRAVY